MNTNVDSLPHYSISRFLRVCKRFVLFGSFHKLMLPIRTGILTPEPLQIYGANITPASLRPKNTVNLFKIFKSGLIIIPVAASQSPRRNIILTSAQSPKRKRFCVSVKRKIILVYIVHASTLCNINDNYKLTENS
jgi:hypothetical protein